MAIKIGDKVKFLNSVGGGRVVGIINKTTLNVLTDDDFEIPSIITELVKVEDADPISLDAAYTKNSSKDSENKKKKQGVSGKQLVEEEDFIQDEPFKFEKKVVTFDKQDEEPYQRPSDDWDLYMVFVPQKGTDPTASDLDVYLVNDSNYDTIYHIATIKDKLHKSYKQGTIEANTKEKIDTLKRNNVAEVNEYIYQLLPFKKKDLYLPKAPVFKSVKVAAVKLSKTKSYTSNDYFDEPSVLFTIMKENQLENEVIKLTDADVNKIIVQKESQSKQAVKPKEASRKEVVQHVVDLHIHELLESEMGLSAKDMLDVQMDRFRNEMEDAISNGNIHKLVFIHGVGNGRLKMEITRELDAKYRKYKYQDASFKEFGYGATLIFLK